MSGLRILLVSEDIPHPQLGGLGKHVVTLGNALIEAGHSVDIFGNNYWPYNPLPGDVPFCGAVLPMLNVKHAHWKETQLGFFNYYSRAFLANRFAKAILKAADRYDVIHYHGHVPIVANFVPESINFIQTRHDQGSDCLIHTRFRRGDVCRETDPRVCAGCATAVPNTLQSRLSAASVLRWRREVTAAFRRHKVIFVSRFLRDNLTRTLGPFDGARTYVVHNFVDIHVLRQALAQDNGAPLPAPDIFIASRVDAAKGVGAFLAAAEGQLPPERRITVVGDGPELAVLRQRFKGKWVEFLGWQAHGQTIAFTSRATVVAVPSVWEEPCGTTVLEPLALGNPVAALNRGGTPELKRYERFVGQLRLAEDMTALVSAALNVPPHEPMAGANESFAGDVRARVPEIEAVYREYIRYPTRNPWTHSGKDSICI